MSFRHCAFAATLLAWCAAVACVRTSEPESLGSDSDLIRGGVAPDDAFLSTMQIVDNCTVTKVGERILLTAAHCVRTPDGRIAAGFVENTPLDVRVRTGGAVEESRTLRVARTVLHPRIAGLCKANDCEGTASKSRRDAPDIAIIEVKGGLDGIPAAAIDVAPVQPGDAVTILGYGCQTNIRTADGDGVLRFRDTQSVGVESTIHSGGLTSSETEALETIDASYNFTRGPYVRRPLRPDAAVDAAAAELFAGLCPGDSGGGVFRTGKNVVVGVNASYTFAIDSSVPTTNWHARVDGLARWGTAAWLESMGATLTASCTVESCKPARAAE